MNLSCTQHSLWLKFKLNSQQTWLSGSVKEKDLMLMIQLSEKRHMCTAAKLTPNGSPTCIRLMKLKTTLDHNDLGMMYN